VNAAPSIDAVVTHHVDGFRSGVARFNEILAARLDVPLLRLDDERAAECRAPLLSFKITEIGEPERALLDRILARSGGRGVLFLHAWGGTPFERDAVARVGRVICANGEIAEQVTPLVPTVTLWAPGLILDQREFPNVDLSVFSFGMAHKIQTESFLRLRDLLEGTGHSYAVYISSANHETTTMQEADSVYRDMSDLFGTSLCFMGNLSDLAVYNQLRATTFFASFFVGGVRANNTSVNAALEHGAVVITNLDEHSPAHLVHMENVIDIDRCEALPVDPDALERISAGARQAAEAHSWDRLVGDLDQLQAG
jgi:hypothetical protein